MLRSKSYFEIAKTVLFFFFYGFINTIDLTVMIFYREMEEKQLAGF